MSPRQVALALDRAFAEMTFVHGWVHADPHPGNIMIRRAGRRGFLAWLFGGSWQSFEVGSRKDKAMPFSKLCVAIHNGAKLTFTEVRASS